MPHRRIKREYWTLKKAELGPGYVMSAPKIRALVLSGAGAKIITYVGMILSMSNRKFIEQITHVTGASAGAITASVLAFGMPASDILQLVPCLNLINFLDYSGKSLRAQGDRLRNVLEVIYMLQIKQHLASIKQISVNQKENYAKLENKISNYTKVLLQEDLYFDTIQDVIQLLQPANALEMIGKTIAKIPQIRSFFDEKYENPSISFNDLGRVTAFVSSVLTPNALEKLDNAFQKLSKMRDPLDEKSENPRIDFSDLHKLKELLPQEHLIKSLTVVTTNQNKYKAEYHNEMTTPDQSIAEAVVWSSAHPLLFEPKKNSKGEFMADAGIEDNMPVEIPGMDAENILCVVPVTSETFDAYVSRTKENALEEMSKFYEGVDEILKFALGGRFFSGNNKAANDRKIFSNLDNLLFLDSGTIDTLSVNATIEEKEIALAKSFALTEELLNSRTKTFQYPLKAALYLGVNQLRQLQKNNVQASELAFAAIQAEALFILQNKMIQDLNNGDLFSVPKDIKQMKTIIKLDEKLPVNEQNNALDLCLQQVSYMTQGRWDNVLFERNNSVCSLF